MKTGGADDLTTARPGYTPGAAGFDRIVDGRGNTTTILIGDEADDGNLNTIIDRAEYACSSELPHIQVRRLTVEV